jgi:ABC-type phosphate/phosphonate transport system substrate-binding protein
MSLASLPMYDLPELRAATDAWWRGLARAFEREGIGELPDSLDRRESYQDVWVASDLLFSQTCGYPLMHALAGRVELVATPCYRADGCDGPSYCSFVIVGAESKARAIDDLRGLRCAINGLDSQSGHNALRSLVASVAKDGRFFGSVTITGGHKASLALVASGWTDVAAIDCVTHGLLAQYRPQALAGTRVLCRTASAPGLPYVTRAGADADLLRRLRSGLERAMTDPQLAATRDALMLGSVAILPLSAYERIRQMEDVAAAAGYREVA